MSPASSSRAPGRRWCCAAWRRRRHANAALPCGAQFLSAKLEGRYVNALFRLTNRAGQGGAGGCGSGVGETARTNFVIRDGQIIAWLRAPDEPGDNGTPKSSPPPAPTTPGGGSEI